MIVFHGSDMMVEQPEILQSNRLLDFIIANRSGKSIEKEYDIVIGPVADDNVYLTVKLFETGVLNKEETIKRLKIEKLFDQIMFHTERSLIFCDFYDSISLGD